MSSFIFVKTLDGFSRSNVQFLTVNKALSLPFKVPPKGARSFLSVKSQLSSVTFAL